MAKNAVLGTGFIDGIVPALDALRQVIADTTGKKQYQVFLRTETWSGSEPGDGDVTVTEVQITPPPQVDFPVKDANGYVVRAQGREENADCVLSQVSLLYAENELMPQTLAKNVAFMYRVADGQGQGVPDRLFVPLHTPRADRNKTIGWVVPLKQRELS